MGELLERLRAVIYRRRRPGKCYVCKTVLPDNATGDVCSSPACDDEDESRRQW